MDVGGCVIAAVQLLMYPPHKERIVHAKQNPAAKLIAHLVWVLPEMGGQDGPIGLVFGDGGKITAELDGSHRFPGGARASG
jgi:hypothetical protein